MHVILLLILTWAATVHAKPLEPADIVGARNIGVMLGTFDPVTRGHIRVAEDAARQFGLDFVILVPNHEPWHKEPLPVDERLAMIHVAAQDSDVVYYPFEGVMREAYDEGAGQFNGGFVRALRTLNPDVKIHAIVGDDLAVHRPAIETVNAKTAPDHWIVSCRQGIEKCFERIGFGRPVSLLQTVTGLSSTQVREFLHERWPLFFAGDVDESEFPPALDPRVGRYILKHGLYLNTLPSNRSSLPARLLQLVTRQLKMHLSNSHYFNSIKELFIKRHARRTLNPADIRGLDFKVIRYLGSGTTADAFLVEAEGQRLVLKVANARGKSRAVIKNSLPVHMWALEKEGLSVPRVEAFDPQGAWILEEYIEGPTVAYLLSQGAKLSYAQYKSLQDLHYRVRVFFENHHVKLDFAADNIVLRGDQAYLIDLGPMPAYVPVPQHFSEQYQRWTEHYAPKCETELITRPRPVRQL